VICHTRELAYQISGVYERFAKYMEHTKVAVFFGGMPISRDERTLKDNCPHVVVGTPGRILALVRKKSLNLSNLKHFILDECDKVLDQLGGWHLNCSGLYAQVMCIPYIFVEQADKDIYFIIHLICFTHTSDFRHETRCAGNISGDSTRETSHDVLCYTVQGYPTGVQALHARCNYRSNY
jgi:hypothetical protein